MGTIKSMRAQNINLNLLYIDGLSSLSSHTKQILYGALLFFNISRFVSWLSQYLSWHPISNVIYLN